jgi:hypothetical protein
VRWAPAGARLLVAASLAAAGCTRPGAGTTPAASPSAPPTLAPEALDRLRSIGYVGFSGTDPRGGVVRRDPGAQPGLNVFTSPHLCSAAVVDEAGDLENFWDERPCGRWSHAELTASGDLLVLGVEPGQAGDPDDPRARRFLMKLGWRGERLWKRGIPAHHDVRVTPAGQLLTILTRVRATPPGAAAPVRDNEIALLTPDGVVLESLSLYDAWLASPQAPPLRWPSKQRRGGTDLFHANAVEWLGAPVGAWPASVYAEGDVLVTMRHQDAIAILDWRARRVSWAWGAGEVSGPHDARLLPNGHILLFDNGLARGWSRVVELDPAARRVVWEYRAPRPPDFYTVSRGSNQRLANGNTLIAESDRGRAFEVTPAGAVTWEFLNPFRNERSERASIVRMRRVDRRVIDGIVARRGAGRRDVPAFTEGSRATAASPAARP